MSSKPLDTSCIVETPEGVEFSASVVGPIPRILAYTVDLLWRTLIIFLIGIAALFIGQAGVGFLLISTFLLEWFYPVFFEVFKNGQTPGKKAFGLRVVNDDFTPVNWSNSCIRNLLRAVDFLPSMYVFGLISMVLTKRFQRLGDLAAGTLVIYQLPEKAFESDDDVTAKPPSFSLSSDEQLSFANFSLRAGAISKSRQVELANILKPTLRKEGEPALNELKSIGAWLLGKK